MNRERNLIMQCRRSLIVFAGALLLGAVDRVEAGINRWTTNGPHAYVSALAIPAADPSTVYAATGGAGVFRSADAGRTWAAINTGLTNLRVWALAIDPITPSTVYAGSDFGGVFKSTDGGENWRFVSVGSRGSVGELAIDPKSPDTLYAGTLGVFKSTNGGETWRAIGLSGFIALALAVDPLTPSTVYASGTDLDSDGVFKSADGGGSWTTIVNLDIAGALAIHPLNPSTLYAGGFPTGVYRSTDGGGNWSAVNAGLPDKRVVSLALDPRNPSTLYAATRGGGVFRSTDGGESWTPFNLGLTNLNINALAIDATGTRLYAGTSGGVFDYQFPLSPCSQSLEDLCLLGNRFEAILWAMDPRTGRTGIGQAVPQSDRFGYFSLPDFTGDPAFPEIFVKMVDATSAPSPFGGSFWVFYGGLTDLQYTMTVTDTVAGEVKSYRNDPAYPMCGGADTSAFKNIGASGQQLTVGNAGPATSLAAAEGTELALLGNRFRVALSAAYPRTGNTAVGQAMSQGDRFGYFSLPDFTGDPAFPEVFVKMADGTSSSGGSF